METNIGKKVIIRGDRSGVEFGTLVAQNGSRRIFCQMMLKSHVMTTTTSRFVWKARAIHVTFMVTEISIIMLLILIY